MERSPLINRIHEIAELRAALDAALGGDGRMVLLAGEPGIGKTRLARLVATEAEARGVPVWWGRGWEDGSAPAFWPWNTALRRWIDRVGAEDVARAVGAWGPELAHVFPVLRDRLPALPAGEQWESDRARFRVFDAVSRFLAAVAAPAGLVVVLDDLHWADRSSLKLLEFVAAELGSTRLLVVATYRDTEVVRDDALDVTLSSLVREATTSRLLVEGLEPAHCAEWITATGVRGDAAALGEALHRETNGNPFYVSEIVQLLRFEAEPEEAVSEVPVVPQGVRELVGRRLARLGDACRSTLAVAALLGDTIDGGLLATLLGDAATMEHLALAVRDRILIEVEGGYAFAHALTRRVLADELAPAARAAWHARIAAALEQQVSDSEAVTTEIVHHLAAAGTVEALRLAFHHAWRGAEHAARDLGWEEAVRLYEIALDVGGRSGLLDPPRANEIRLSLARALRGVGDVPGARERCEEVITACRRAPDPEVFTRAALLYAGRMPEWGRVEPRVRALLEEACRDAAALPDALRARLHARLAGDLIAANAVDQGDRIFALCEQAVAAARRAGDAGALAIALLGVYTTAVMELAPSAPDRLLADAGKAIVAADASGEHEYAAVIRYLHAMLLFADGDADGFARETDELATAAAATRVPEARWFAEVLDALRATVQGRFAEGRAAMERALAVGQRAQLPNALGVYASQRIMWHALTGRLAEMCPELDAFVEGHPIGVGWRPLRALARLAAGDVAYARAELKALLALGLKPGRGVMARTYLVGLGSLAIGVRDRDAAAAIYEVVARRDDTWTIGGGQTLGPWALVLGGLARLCDRPADAVRHFESAITLGRQMGAPPIVARAQSRLASLLLSLQPDADARARIAAMLAEASATATAIGLADVATRVARLQARLATAPVADVGNWFRNEGDVWTVRYAGRDLRLKDGKGPRYLASLLSAPGREVHVLQFMTAAPAPTGASTSAAAALHDGLVVGGLGGAVEDAPDEQARRAYRERLADLRAELEEAEQFADAGRAERLQGEIEQLMTQLATRFAGRPARRSPSETARKAVTKVIRTQIGKLVDAHPALGRHLKETVRMGTVCVYAPQTPVSWDVAFASH